MAVNESITREKKHNAVDMLVTLVVDELEIDLQMSRDEILSRFIASKTGELLYDEDSNLWWNGPSDIAEQYKKELQA